MTPELGASLSRTIQLIRDEVIESTPADQIIQALTHTRVALVCDASNLASHSAQSAFAAAAILLARSGHQVHLLAPDVQLVSLQAPLIGSRLIAGLLELGDDMLPGIAFSVLPPRAPADLQVLFGDSPPRVRTGRTIHINAGNWVAKMGGSEIAARWRDIGSPFGALLSAVLVAAEACKIAMHRLSPYARGMRRFSDLLAPTPSSVVRLAPEDAPVNCRLEEFDLVSAGAINNAVLFALARIPNATGKARVLDDDIGVLSNLNRYPLFRASSLNLPKVRVLQQTNFGGIEVIGLQQLYRPENDIGIQFAPRVIVGVDHIPSRWAVQRADPKWLAVGATSHWDAMASFHHTGLACAGCLHPRDDPTPGDLPTIAFVSFLAGLATAAYFARHVAGQPISKQEQNLYGTAFHLRASILRPVPPRDDCPVRCSLSQQSALVA